MKNYKFFKIIIINLSFSLTGSSTSIFEVFFVVNYFIFKSSLKLKIQKGNFLKITLNRDEKVLQCTSFIFAKNIVFTRVKDEFKRKFHKIVGISKIDPCK